MSLLDICPDLFIRSNLDTFLHNTKDKISVVVDGEVYLNKFNYDVGTLIDIHPSSPHIGVEFTRALNNGHDCRGHGMYGYCYYVYPENIVSMTVSQRKVENVNGL